MLAILWIFRHRNAAQGQPRVPARPDGLGGRDGARARPPGRAEDDGRDLPGAGHAAATSRPTTGAAALGHRSSARRDLARHLLRRLADHAHPRPPDHPPRPAARASPPSRSARPCSTPRRSSTRRRSPPPTSSPRRSWASGATRRFSAVRWGMARLDRDRLGAHLPRRRRRRRPLLRRPAPPPRLTPARDAPGYVRDDRAPVRDETSGLPTRLSRRGAEQSLPRSAVRSRRWATVSVGIHPEPEERKPQRRGSAPRARSCRQHPSYDDLRFARIRRDDGEVLQPTLDGLLTAYVASPLDTLQVQRPVVLADDTCLLVEKIGGRRATRAVEDRHVAERPGTPASRSR